MGTVNGTAGNDEIGLDYVDAEGDQVQNSHASPDHVEGGDGNDKIELHAGDDTAYGGEGDDSIYGHKGENELHGGPGNDLLHSGRHTSVVYGDAGDDTIVAQLDKGGDHTLTGGEGADTFHILTPSASNVSNVTITDFLASQDTLLIAGETIDFTDLPGGVSLTLDENDDVLLSFGDNETILFPNSDIEEFIPYWNLLGQVDGSDGNDRIEKGYSDGQGETVSDGDDLVYAGAGDDRVKGYAGDDTIHGGEGNDTIYGNKGNNQLFGDEGEDHIHGGRHSSEMYGGDGDDVLIAQLNKGADHTLSGGEGGDSFRLFFASTRTEARTEITDFEHGSDVVEIDGMAIDFEDLPEGMSLADDEDGNAVLSFSDDETITFTGVSSATLRPEPGLLRLGDGTEIPIAPLEDPVEEPESEEPDPEIL